MTVRRTPFFLLASFAVLLMLVTSPSLVSAGPKSAVSLRGRAALTSTDPGLVGQWEAPVDVGLPGINSAVLPNGKVLLYGKVLVDGFGSGGVVFDPSNNTYVDATIQYQENPFCGGLSFLPDGRLLASGGEIASIPGGETGNGNHYTNIFDWTKSPPTTGWSTGNDMNNERWYPTNVVAGDGSTYIFSGRTSRGAVVTAVERYDPGTGVWTQLPPTANKDLNGLYPRMFLLPSGRIFHAGEDNATNMLDLSTNSWSKSGSFVFGRRMAGGVVLLPGLQKVLAAGGSGTNTAELIDFSLPGPAWRYTAPMNMVRNHGNFVLLPDGTVAAIGGGYDPLPGGDSLNAEIFDPVAETWTLMAAQQYGREYHTSAVLLPDGRVISAGGEATIGDTTVEIFEPPYLFHGARPLITLAPTTLTYGQKVTVRSPDAATITKIALIRPGATTHGFDQDQRYVNLKFSLVNGKLKVTGPANGNVAPPGYYMLFLINSSGVPSIATFVHVG